MYPTSFSSSGSSRGVKRHHPLKHQAFTGHQTPLERAASVPEGWDASPSGSHDYAGFSPASLASSSGQHITEEMELLTRPAEGQTGVKNDHILGSGTSMNYTVRNSLDRLVGTLPTCRKRFLSGDLMGNGSRVPYRSIDGRTKLNSARSAMVYRGSASPGEKLTLKGGLSIDENNVPQIDEIIPPGEELFECYQDPVEIQAPRSAHGSHKSKSRPGVGSLKLKAGRPSASLATSPIGRPVSTAGTIPHHSPHVEIVKPRKPFHARYGLLRRCETVDATDAPRHSSSGEAGTPLQPTSAASIPGITDTHSLRNSLSARLRGHEPVASPKAVGTCNSDPHVPTSSRWRIVKALFHTLRRDGDGRGAGGEEGGHGSSRKFLGDGEYDDERRPKDTYIQLSNTGGETSLCGSPKEEEISPTREMPSTKSSNMASTTYLREQIIALFQPSDNKLAMKLFGNKNALMKEKMRQKAAGNWVIHPCSNFRFYWDAFMLVLLIGNLIILPVAISFFNDDLSPQWIVFNTISDTVFLLDLIINFRTGIIADNFADEVILDPKEIAKHYIRTWFLLDFISSVPLDYLILLPMANDATVATQIIHAGRALRIFRLVKLLSLLRLLRLSRLVRYISQWEEVVHFLSNNAAMSNSKDIGQFLALASKFMRIFNLVCLILLLGHWNGCLQWLVPMLQDFPPDSWPALEELKHAEWSEQYTWALFKALSHMLCIGYGRFPPQSTTDVWLTTVSMLTGATCYALFVGHSTTLIQSFDTSKRLYAEKFKQVEEYMTYRKLPRHLRQKISEYYEHRFRGKMFDEHSILSEVNECLKEEIVNFNCRSLVASVPFFTHADPNFVTEVVTKLEYEVFQPGDFIIKEGTMGTKMYFIQEGIVDIVTVNGEVATSLSDGSYFGEICLLTNARRVASVRAETYCNLFSLSVDLFHSVLEHYPVVRRTLESVAAQRLNKIGKNPAIVTSRADFEDDINTVNELLMRGGTTDASSDNEQGEEREGTRVRIDSGSGNGGVKRRKKWKKGVAMGGVRFGGGGLSLKSRKSTSLTAKDAREALQQTLAMVMGTVVRSKSVCSVGKTSSASDAEGSTAQAGAECQAGEGKVSEESV